MRNILIFLIAGILFIGCKESVEEDNNHLKDTTITEDFPGVVKVKNKVFNVPSPVQASYLVKEQDIRFDKSLLNNADNYVNYLTTFKQALNIGVYGANLGNLFIYDQLSESAQYFNVVKKLSEQVGVLNSIDRELLQKIEKNSDNKDSLTYLMSDIYKEIDAYLMENEQEDLGLLIIAGGWVESLYLLTKIAEENKNPEIISRIGEQKNPLNHIIELLHPYYNVKSDDFDYLHEELVDLSIVFEGIEETYTYEAPETDPENKITVIHSVTNYNITDEDLKEISEKVEKIRNWIIE